MVIAVTLAGGCRQALADEQPQPFPSLDCPSGMFLSGIVFRSGAWLDAIGIECTNFDKSLEIFGGTHPVDAPMVGGTGGSAHESRCPVHMAVGTVNETYTRDPDGGHVDDLIMICHPYPATSSPDDAFGDHGYVVVNTEDDEANAEVIGDLLHAWGPPDTQCIIFSHPASYATGIHGRTYENSINFVGLNCTYIFEDAVGTSSSSLKSSPPVSQGIAQPPAKAIANNGTTPVIPPKCPAGSRQVADQNHLPPTWVTFTVALNGQSILCAKPGPKTTIDHIGTTSAAIPCPAGMERQADGKCVAKVKVAKKTAPEAGTASRTQLCPDGSQPQPDGSCLTLNFNANNPIPFLCPNGSCLKTAPPPNLATQSPVHPGDPICPGGAARLKNGQCPTAPGQSNLHLFGAYKSQGSTGTNGLR